MGTASNLRQALRALKNALCHLQAAHTQLADEHFLAYRLQQQIDGVELEITFITSRLETSQETNPSNSETSETG